jgi:hypothetical protein
MKNTIFDQFPTDLALSLRREDFSMTVSDDAIRFLSDMAEASKCRGTDFETFNGEAASLISSDDFSEDSSDEPEPPEDDEEESTSDLFPPRRAGRRCFDLVGGEIAFSDDESVSSLGSGFRLPRRGFVGVAAEAAKGMLAKKSKSLIDCKSGRTRSKLVENNGVFLKIDVSSTWERPYILNGRPQFKISMVETLAMIF